MSYALPFASVHSCICGYSLGLKQTRIPGISQLAEQCARVLGVYLLYTAAIQESGQAGIILAICGLVIGEIAGTFYSIFAVRRILYTKKAAQKCSVSCYAGCPWRYFKTCRTYHGQPDFFEYSSKHRGCFHSKVPHALRLLPLRSPEPLRNPERDRHALYFVSVCHHQFHLHDDAPHCGRDSGSKPEPDSEAADPEGKYLLPSAWFFLYLRLSSDRGLSRLLCLSKSGRPPPTYGCWLLSARFSIQIRTYISMLNGLGHTGLAFLINFTGLCIRIAGVFFLIPQTGISGYLTGLLSSQIFVFLASVRVLFRTVQRI